MKKIFLSSIGILVILVFSACQSGSPEKAISNSLGIDVSGGTVTEARDSHGGFHGDGQTFVSITFSDDSVEKAISENSLWKPLPLSMNLKALVYGVPQSGPYLKDENGEPSFPEIQNGYYYFEDRQVSDKGENRYDDANVYEKYSFNLTIAIYDTDTDTLYYSEFDT